MMASAFAGIAASLSQAFGGPFHAATLHRPTEPDTDDGGSIVAPGEPDDTECLCQVDAVTQAMRQADEFVDTDVRLLILASPLDGEVRVGNTVTVSEGPRPGEYAILSVDRDPMQFAWECRGRRP